MYPNSVRHICDKGFVLRGSPEIKCQANGTWSKTSSFCEGRKQMLVVTMCRGITSYSKQQRQILFNLKTGASIFFFIFIIIIYLFIFFFTFDYQYGSSLNIAAVWAWRLISYFKQCYNFHFLTSIKLSVTGKSTVSFS